MMTIDFEDRLDEIRVELYEDTKGLSTKDAVAYINDNGRMVAERYGIPVVKSTPLSFTHNKRMV